MARLCITPKLSSQKLEISVCRGVRVLPIKAPLAFTSL